MPDDDRQLEAALGTSLRSLAQHKGLCPSVEQILQYQARELSQEDEGEIRAHLLACGHCEMLLLRIEGFSAAVAAPETPRGTMLRFLGRPAPAYSFAAILLVGLATSLGQKHGTAPATHPAVIVQTLPSFELPQTRGLDDFVVRPGGSESFILRFFVPMGPGSQYVAAIRDQGGREAIAGIEVDKSDGRGNVDMVCRAKAFPAGSYLLTIVEKGSQRELSFSFQVQ
jgi:hypothetical protein